MISTEKNKKQKTGYNANPIFRGSRVYLMNGLRRVISAMTRYVIGQPSALAEPKILLLSTGERKNTKKYKELK